MTFLNNYPPQGLFAKVLYKISNIPINNNIKICRKVEEAHGCVGELEAEWIFREDVIFEATKITIGNNLIYTIECKPVAIYDRVLNVADTNFYAPGCNIDLLYLI